MSDPVSMSVPIGHFSEVELIAALDYVAENFQKHRSVNHDTWHEELKRAAHWFNERYGVTQE